MYCRYFDMKKDINMSKEFIRESKIDKLTQAIINSGKFIVDVSSPLSACKRALEQIEQRNEDRFIENVLNDINTADIESLDAVKSLTRLYKVIQVINKATTQDKINRFRQLTVNGIINQESLSDNNFELFVNIIDNLTDLEFIILSAIHRIENEHLREAYDLIISKNSEKELLKELNMDNNLFISYITLLKGKGMITPLTGKAYKGGNEDPELTDVIFTADATIITSNEDFCINNVNGHVSILFRQLLEYIN